MKTNLKQGEATQNPEVCYFPIIQLNQSVGTASSLGSRQPEDPHLRGELVLWVHCICFCWFARPLANGHGRFGAQLAALPFKPPRPPQKNSIHILGLQAITRWNP